MTIVPDAGGKYLSKMFNDYWLMDQGIIEREAKGDLSDLSRRHAEQATVSIAPDDMLMTALARMKLYDFQQLPVLEGDKVVGIIDESDILMTVYGDANRFRTPVRDAMTSRLETLQAGEPIDALPWCSTGAGSRSSWTATGSSASLPVTTCSTTCAAVRVDPMNDSHGFGTRAIHAGQARSDDGRRDGPSTRRRRTRNESRRAQGLRIRAHAESHANGVRALHRRPRRWKTRSHPDSPLPPRCSTRCRREATPSRSTTSTAERIGCSNACGGAPPVWT